MPVSEHEKKMVDLRYQLQQNQTELSDYLADLTSWEAEIKEKEDKMKSGQADKAAALPPVRNTIHKKKLKKKRKEKAVDPDKPKKISGFDFRAWDKFDVDKALEEIDKDDGEMKGSSSSEYETDEEWEMERKKHLANTEKEKGNMCLKAEDYTGAVEAYSKGIEFDATNALLPANRALAFLKQQKFAAAELDCTSSISLDPLYVKAYLRRAAARVGMGKLDEAVSDYRRVLDIEPNNKQATSEVDRIGKEIQRAKHGPVSSSLTVGDTGIVKPIYKPVGERSKVPLKRILIEEIGLETTKPKPAIVAQSEVAKNIRAKESSQFDKLFVSTPPVSTGLPTNGSSQAQNEDLVSHVSHTGHEQSNSDQTPPSKASPPNLNFKSKSHEGVNGTSHDPSASPSSKSHSQTTSPRTSSSASKVEDSATASPATGSGDSFSVPQSSFQLQADFKLLKHKPEAFFQYFQAIPPSQYQKLFGQSLDADILTKILHSLAANSHKSNQDLYEVLFHLTEVKRFSMTAMFLSRKDKEVASGLLKQLRESGNICDSDITALSKKYDL